MTFPIVLLILALVALILIFSGVWPTIFGAPWVPTRMALVHKMMELAEVGPGDIVVDLGCADGRILVTAARNYGARAIGIEIEPLKFLWCQLLITVLGLRKQVAVKLGNFHNHDLSESTVVICYLLKETNQHLMNKLKKELSPGACVVSNTFTFPRMKPVKESDDILLYLFNGE